MLQSVPEASFSDWTLHSQVFVMYFLVEWRSELHIDVLTKLTVWWDADYGGDFNTGHTPVVLHYQFYQLPCIRVYISLNTQRGWLLTDQPTDWYIHLPMQGSYTFSRIKFQDISRTIPGHNSKFSRTCSFRKNVDLNVFLPEFSSFVLHGFFESWFHTFWKIRILRP